VDILLMDALMDAVPEQARLVLVGDADQLPSVGAGRVLGDILDSEIVRTVRLTEVYRQAKESLIIMNAHSINRGEYPRINEKDRDFFMIGRNSELSICETILSLCGKRLPGYYADLDPIRDIQVLTPVKKSMIGTIHLNENLQKLLNPPLPGRAELKTAGRTLRVGDKVMQIRNNYEREWQSAGLEKDGAGVFNGDIGFISDIDTEDGLITVLYDETKYVQYEISDLDEIELAYAMTIHKSQGSEFPCVILSLDSPNRKLYYRNLLYTAVTRAKQLLLIMGNSRAVPAMVENNRKTLRYTNLAGFLSEQTQA
ncbi:MAG TPA: ATP-dependent RecD-like DNA helicase, partial [Ruminococcaceae bacterium]|nr:ATP-dependent RecD-like DNA helicase [Oscillospiraceae bacterium]